MVFFEESIEFYPSDHVTSLLIRRSIYKDIRDKRD